MEYFIVFEREDGTTFGERTAGKNIAEIAERHAKLRPDCEIVEISRTPQMSARQERKPSATQWGSTINFNV